MFDFPLEPLPPVQHKPGPAMLRAGRRGWLPAGQTRWLACLLLLLLPVAGCTPLGDYVRNGFKVGPNFATPPAPVAKTWIDAADKRVRQAPDDLSQWWTVFEDPKLNSLICLAYQQNLSLREAGFRVMQARAERDIAIGGIFPQLQQATGDYIRSASSRETAGRGSNTGTRFFSQWDYGFRLSWELDFWGRYRRAIEAAEDTLDASVANYDDVLVTLLGDVASNYVQMRSLQQRIILAKANAKLQTATYEIALAKFKGGQTSELDVNQSRSNLAQTEALIPLQEIELRRANNRLCTLLGIPPEDLQRLLGTADIPTAPAEVVLGIPADLLRRRPDIRRAEYEAAAQCALIGVAETELYPHIRINGTLGYSAAQFKDLFNSKAFTGTVGPSFAWDVLNYGRLINQVRAQDAVFQQAVVRYQRRVLQANQEVEDGFVVFLRSQEQARYLAESVDGSQKALKLALVQYAAGLVDFNRVALLQQNLVQQQDALTRARSDVALGLIEVYRALGGGWQLRFTGCKAGPLTPQQSPEQPEQGPPPRELPPAGPTPKMEPDARTPPAQFLPPPNMTPVLGRPQVLPPG